VRTQELLKLAANPRPRVIAALTSRLGADSAPRSRPPTTHDACTVVLVRDSLTGYADRNHSDNDGWPAESGCGHSRFGGRVSDKFKSSAESVWMKSRPTRRLWPTRSGAE
jgi:hypothetical protein